MKSHWQTDDLPEVEGLIWKALSQATGEPNHPWSLSTLGSVGERGPALRTVVLREADRTWRRLICFSDARAEKVTQLKGNPHTCWHFYDPRHRVQVRASGLSMIEHGTGYARGIWENLPAANKANYLTMGAPGSELDSPAQAHILSAAQPEHFAVIVTTIGLIDWLWLGSSGHRRARFEWHEGNWQGCWTVP